MARDDSLEAALRALAGEIDWPAAAPTTADGTTAGPDIATRVRARLVAGEGRRSPRRWWTLRGRPMRRSLVLAIAALLALAIVAGAVGLGLPGLRITLGEPPASVLPSPTPTATGSRSPTPSPTLPPITGMRLNLGRQVTLDDVEPTIGVAVRLPADERLGPPASVWIDRAKGDQVGYVWKASDDLPETTERGVGLVLMRFDGADDREYYEKMINTGTSIERVKVAGHDGYWISGEPHFFFYTTSDGNFVEDTRRWVGDALIWNDGTATYRIESALGRDATIEIAESIG
ncbi:MAG TPA: hypothetical protein VK867_05540 [Candidatus Limnocylindrales bacterium]|nr:hypothetical protein [Candidatus Limnocylindrales bacterium]